MGWRSSAGAGAGEDRPPAPGRRGIGLGLTSEAPDVDATIYLTVDDRMRVIESLAPVP